MVNKGLTKGRIEAILAVSGGADSVYLLNISRKKIRNLLVAHFNHGVRGKDSEADQQFLVSLCKDWRLSMEVGQPKKDATDFPITRRKGKVPPRFEEKARKTRYAFLKDLLSQHKAQRILVAHTADDQVETVLMRILEGAGFTGLKGIPRSTEDGIERPLLGTWREDILAYLKKHKIPYRVDKSNFDIRFERNWIRNVLIPLLEKRYGKSVKKRIYALGERFRELDAFIEISAHNWIDNNIICHGKNRKSKPPRTDRQGKEAIRIPRKKYAALPSLLRIRILQILCYGRIGTAPNERLLASMDRLIVSGRASARLNIGRGATLRCRYGEGILSLPGQKESSGTGEERSWRTGKGTKRKVRKGEEGGKPAIRKIASEPVLRMEGPGIYRWNRSAREGGGVEVGHSVSIFWENRGKLAPGRIRIMAEGERQAIFDAEMLRLPLSVRPLKAGDRVRPLGHINEKKIKEILIDRKIPREERWGRPVMCDADGRIVWIPRILRSDEAAVTHATKRTIVLRADIEEPAS